MLSEISSHLTNLLKAGEKETNLPHKRLMLSVLMRRQYETNISAERKQETQILHQLIQIL